MGLMILIKVFRKRQFHLVHFYMMEASGWAVHGIMSSTLVSYSHRDFGLWCKRRQQPATETWSGIFGGNAATEKSTILFSPGKRSSGTAETAAEEAKERL